MDNAIIIAVLILIVGAAAWYVIRAKKKGAKCIGCPSGCSCSHSHENHTSCNCGCDKKESK